MELIFLGTSSGTPTKTRNVTALAVKLCQARDWYLVDCGEGSQQQILHTPLSLLNLRGIFITHVHGDHCYGLPGLLASAALAGRTESLLIAAPRAIEKLLQSIYENTALHLNFPIEFRAVDEMAEDEVWADANFRIGTVKLSHRVPCFAYVFDEASVEKQLDTAWLEAQGIARGPLWGRLQRGEHIEIAGEVLHGNDFLLPLRSARRIIVGGDNDTPDLLQAACQRSQVLVHEATYTRDILEKVGSGLQHSSAALVAHMAAACNLPNLVLTHFSPRYGDDTVRSPSIVDISREAAEFYSGRLFLARDFDCFRLNKEGTLIWQQNYVTQSSTVT